MTPRRITTVIIIFIVCWSSRPPTDRPLPVVDRLLPPPPPSSCHPCCVGRRRRELSLSLHPLPLQLYYNTVGVSFFFFWNNFWIEFKMLGPTHSPQPTHTQLSFPYLYLGLNYCCCSSFYMSCELGPFFYIIKFSLNDYLECFFSPSSPSVCATVTGGLM